MELFIHSFVICYIHRHLSVHYQSTDLAFLRLKWEEGTAHRHSQRKADWLRDSESYRRHIGLSRRGSTWVSLSHTHTHITEAMGRQGVAGGSLGQDGPWATRPQRPALTKCNTKWQAQPLRGRLGLLRLRSVFVASKTPAGLHWLQTLPSSQLLLDRWHAEGLLPSSCYGAAWLTVDTDLLH